MKLQIKLEALKRLPPAGAKIVGKCTVEGQKKP